MFKPIRVKPKDRRRGCLSEWVCIGKGQWSEPVLARSSTWLVGYLWSQVTEVRIISKRANLVPLVRVYFRVLSLCSISWWSLIKLLNCLLRGISKNWPDLSSFFLMALKSPHINQKSKLQFLIEFSSSQKLCLRFLRTGISNFALGIVLLS